MYYVSQGGYVFICVHQASISYDNVLKKSDDCDFGIWQCCFNKVRRVRKRVVR